MESVINMKELISGTKISANLGPDLGRLVGRIVGLGSNIPIGVLYLVDFGHELSKEYPYPTAIVHSSQIEVMK